MYYYTYNIEILILLLHLPENNKNNYSHFD